LPQPTRIKLMIVDPDDAFRQHICRLLRQEGYQVFEAGELGDARVILEKSGIDVALMRVKEVEPKGLPLLRMIKEVRPNTEVILMTQSESHSLSISIEAMRLGAFDELLMPFGVETLLDRVAAAHLGKKERRPTN
jgi:DNA-binding NtrC family response regulator